MWGGEVGENKPTNEPEYIMCLMEEMAAGMKPLEALQSQPTAIPVAAMIIRGLVNVGQNIEQHIQILAEDPTANEIVRNAQRMVTQLMGELGSYNQRITEMEQAQQPQGGMDAATIAKVQAIQATTQAKIQSQSQVQQVKLQHKDAQFLAEQERKDAQTVAEIRRKDALTHADVAAKDLTTRADLVHQARQAGLDQTLAAADKAQELQHGAIEHQQETAHAQEAHETELQQAQEKHDVDLQAQKAKATAAKKAKPTPKANG